MASVTKNPVILQSVMYVYNFFLAINQNKDNDIAKNATLLENVEADEKTLKYVKKTNESNYNNIDLRIKKIKGDVNG